MSSGLMALTANSIPAFNVSRHVRPLHGGRNDPLTGDVTRGSQRPRRDSALRPQSRE